MFNIARKYGTVNRIDYLKDVFFPDGKHSQGRYCKLTELPYYEVSVCVGEGGGAGLAWVRWLGAVSSCSLQHFRLTLPFC